MTGPRIALLYDDGAYVETLSRPRQAMPGAPIGLMGRQVAGKAFLDAYLAHGAFDELVALVRNRHSRDSLQRRVASLGPGWSERHGLRIVEMSRFHDEFLADAAARVLHLPMPLERRYAWARRHAAPGSFALSGVTHTLCSLAGVEALCDLLTAPYEPWDALICTSRAVVEMVRSVTGAYADFLRERHGGDPRLRVRIEQIPLGVDTEKYRPATPEERARERHALGIEDDEVAALFVGRFSQHAKAHPFPMFRGLAEAARRSGARVHLTLAGWAASDAVMRGFLETARAVAPGLRMRVVDGTRPEMRFAVWRAADLFTSLSDSIQETFGLVIIEAMACGLPVVATDWDGYRDLVVDGETGFLVPTAVVGDATRDATSRLLVGEVDYDHFLAECNQAVAVDVTCAADAYARLVADAELRRRMGAAGRERAAAHFAWPEVIRAYEALWASQEKERAAASGGAAAPSRFGPECYPAPDRCFGHYPTRLLSGEDVVEARDGAGADLDALLRMPLTNYVPERRSADAAQLLRVLGEASRARRVAELDAFLAGEGLSPMRSRATLAWLLKYDLLRVASDPR